MADGVPMTHDQRKELPHDRLGIERRLIGLIASPNRRKVLARQHGFGPADQGRQEAVEHLDVHGVLSATSLKYFGEKFSVGQRLCAHDPKFARWRTSDIESILEQCYKAARSGGQAAD